MQEPMIQEALRAEHVFAQDEINRRAYELREKAERDYRGQMMYATKQGMAQGMAQGMEKMKKLIQCLIDDGKSAEIPAVLADEHLQEKMFRRYNITLPSE